MVRTEVPHLDLVVVGSEKERRKEEIDHLSLNLYQDIPHELQPED